MKIRTMKKISPRDLNKFSNILNSNFSILNKLTGTDMFSTSVNSEGELYFHIMGFDLHLDNKLGFIGSGMLFPNEVLNKVVPDLNEESLKEQYTEHLKSTLKTNIKLNQSK